MAARSAEAEGVGHLEQEEQLDAILRVIQQCGGVDKLRSMLAQRTTTSSSTSPFHEAEQQLEASHVAGTAAAEQRTEAVLSSVAASSLAAAAAASSTRFCSPHRSTAPSFPSPLQHHSGLHFAAAASQLAGTAAAEQRTEAVPLSVAASSLAAAAALSTRFHSPHRTTAPSFPSPLQHHSGMHLAAASSQLEGIAAAAPTPMAPTPMPVPPGESDMLCDPKPCMACSSDSGSDTDGPQMPESIHTQTKYGFSAVSKLERVQQLARDVGVEDEVSTLS